MVCRIDADENIAGNVLFQLHSTGEVDRLSDNEEDPMKGKDKKDKPLKCGWEESKYKECAQMQGFGKKCTTEDECKCPCQTCFDMPFVGKSCSTCRDMGIEE